MRVIIRFGIAGVLAGGYICEVEHVRFWWLGVTIVAGSVGLLALSYFCSGPRDTHNTSARTKGGL